MLYRKRCVCVCVLSLDDALTNINFSIFTYVKASLKFWAHTHTHTLTIPSIYLDSKLQWTALALFIHKWRANIIIHTLHTRRNIGVGCVRQGYTMNSSNDRQFMTSSPEIVYRRFGWHTDMTLNFHICAYVQYMSEDVLLFICVFPSWQCWT